MCSTTEVGKVSSLRICFSLSTPHWPADISSTLQSSADVGIYRISLADSRSFTYKPTQPDFFCKRSYYQLRYTSPQFVSCRHLKITPRFQIHPICRHPFNWSQSLAMDNDISINPIYTFFPTSDLPILLSQCDFCLRISKLELKTSIWLQKLRLTHALLQDCFQQKTLQ